MTNHTCPRPKDWNDLQLKSEPIVGSFSFQHIIAIVACALTGVTLSLSLWLILKHLHRYTFPSQQRQIIRMIFTPVVFAVFSLLSIVFYDQEKYLTPIRDLYESFALVALFLLFSDFVSPNFSTSERFSYFTSIEPPTTLYKLRYTIVFLYLIVAIIMTITEIASQAAGTYCDTSLAPRFAHFWVTVIENVSISLAVFAIINLYKRLKPMPEFSSHKPLLKLISFKLIVGLNFVQDILFSLLTGQNLIHGNRRVTGKDLAIGIPAFIVAVEQVGFAIFFHYSFRSREYHEDQLGLKGESAAIRRKSTLAAAAHAFNPYDYFEGMLTAVLNALSGGLSRGNGGGNASAGSPDGIALGLGRGRGRGRGQYHNITSGSVEYKPYGAGNDDTHDQAAFLQPEPGTQGRYGRSRSPSPSPMPPAYYQPPPGSPPRAQAQGGRRYEEYRGAERGSADYDIRAREREMM